MTWRSDKNLPLDMNRFFQYRLDHVLFWALTIFFHAYTRVSLVEKAGVFQFALELVVRNVMLAVLIYGNLLLIIPRIAHGKNGALWLCVSLVTLISYTAFKNLHDVYLYGYVIGDTERSTFLHNTLYNFSIALFYLAFATALHLSKQWYQQRELLRQITLEKLHTELDYLKAQLNPHFLFNSINTIFFQIDKHNTEARETLAKFSDMLRYQLYECNGNEIAIEKEIQYLNNYVSLQRLRKDDHYVIEFRVSDTVKNFSVPPLLLIPFIENAFKHISNHSDRKNFIQIDLQKHDDTLQLLVINSANAEHNSGPGGIGLKNVQRRLDLLYPGKHWLTFATDREQFSVNLKLIVA